MDFEGDNLKFQYLAGGDILEYPPKYSSNGEHIFFMARNDINVYSTISYQFVRKLDGSTDRLIDFEFELRNENILIACNSSGEIFSWEWKTGELKNTLRIPAISEKKAVITNFKLLNLYGKSDLAHAFICFKIPSEPINYRLLNRNNGTYLFVPFKIYLTMKKPIVVADTKNFPNLVIAQGHYVFFVDYRDWTYVRYMNANKIPVTVLQMHPTEECVATGDEIGQIFLWRLFSNQKTMKNSLYHWHHTKITSICFTVAGAHFYSSGEESVMVKWSVERPELRQFIPRTAAKIRHIVVSPDNTKVVTCLIDNSIQFYGTENNLYQNLQEFTYITDDNTENSKYPTGLRLNPRNNSLVLNGRIGSLQFYNTYTKSLLYNVNIVNQNLLSKERDRVLYDITVTKAAFNIDWMATGEVFNDEEHLPELRLKFWKYQEENQNYALNTNIELPHEGGFKAIEFSNDYQVENLLCATVGEDNIIKMWSLEDSDNIYKQGKTWYCIAQTSYKDLLVASISFSQDGSLLAAGFGNTLCIYKSDNLKLKAALTGSNGLDGCVTKAQIRVSSKPLNGAKLELAEKRKKLMQLFTNMLETNDETLIKELRKTVNDELSEPLLELDNDQKVILYKKIIQILELNLFQKVLLYQKLGISCKSYPQMEEHLAKYLSKLWIKDKHVRNLHSLTHRLNLRQRFKAKYRLQRHCKEQEKYDRESGKLVHILSLMNLGKPSSSKNKPPTKLQNVKHILLPKPTMAEISHVQFAAGEYAHLVIVCTERRVLIWNLLTLRLQAVLKLSVKHLSFDPQTNLVAVVTHNNELHLFQPNVPLPIYQRQHLPNIHGIAWIPRRHPKQRSINLDWQAQSTLYFINENQEIIYLSSLNDRESNGIAPIIFDNAAGESIQYTTFGTYATKSTSDRQTVTCQNGPLVLANSAKTAIRALVDMSVHTMPPMSLLCEDFLKSLVKCCDSKKVSDTTSTDDKVLTSRLNGDLNGYGSHSDDDDEDDNNTTVPDRGSPTTNGYSPSSVSAKKLRKDLLNKTEELKRTKQSLSTKSDPHGSSWIDLEKKLKHLASQALNIDF